LAHNVFAENQSEQSRWFSIKALAVAPVRAFTLLISLKQELLYTQKYPRQVFSFLICVFFGCIVIPMKSKRGRPPKAPDRLRDDKLLVRLESDEKEAFQSAADLAGVSLSSWVRERLRRVAVKELKEASRPIAFLQSAK
jgi:hypothetical protein